MPSSSPTMSSCFRGGSQSYGFDLDIIKASSSSSFSSSLSSLSSQTSSPSSTLSESSNSPPCTISFKRARAPRKRPNQIYNEAAALLSTINHTIFPTENLKRPSTTEANYFYSVDESPEFLPPFPVLEDAAFLICKHSHEKPSFLFEFKTTCPVENSCTSPTSNKFREPSSPSPLDDDFDTESILDEEVGEGIDSILGNHTKSTTATTTDSDTSEQTKDTYTSHINPYIRGLIGQQSESKFELGLGFRFRRNWHHTALRQRDSSDWWRYPAVPVHEIHPKLKHSGATALSSDKKKKKKVENKEEVAVQHKQKNASIIATASTTTMASSINTATTAVSLQEKIKATGLGLKLNHNEVIIAWSGQGSMFSDGPDSPNSSSEARAKLADIELNVDGGVFGGVREASVMRYKEKRMARLFSKKIRYQVRKVNADSRPRMKGRFVRRPALLHQTIDEES